MYTAFATAERYTELPVQSFPSSRLPYEVCSKRAIPEAVLAGDGLRDAEQQRRVLVRVARLVPGGDEASRPAAAGHMYAEGLRGPDDDVGTVVGRRREDAEGDRVDTDDRLGSDLSRQRCDLGSLRLDAAEERRILEEDSRRTW